MGDVVGFACRHGRASAAAGRTPRGACILAKDSYVTPGMPRSAAAAIIDSQYSTSIRPDRFCSDAVDGPLPITLANSVAPSKAAISSGTVSGTRVESDCGAVVGESSIDHNVYRISVDYVNRTSVEDVGNDAYMGDVGDRLRQARVKAGFKSARKAAEAMGLKYSTYASHENGQTEPDREDVHRYARRFKASPAYILTGEGKIGAQNLAPLMGRIGAGGDIDPDYEQVPEGGIEDIELPINVGIDAIAFEISGASMKPRYDHGALIVCTKSGRDPDGLIGLEVAVRTADNKRYLKTLRAGRRRGLYTLESFNSDPITDVRLAWVGEILAVIPANRRMAFFSQRRRAG